MAPLCSSLPGKEELPSLTAWSCIILLSLVIPPASMDGLPLSSPAPHFFKIQPFPLKSGYS